MLETLETIKELAKQAKWDIDLMDVGCTLTNAMNKKQIADLNAMIKFLQKCDDSPGSILANVLHDLNGLKAVYFKQQSGAGFSPRSFGYAKKKAS